MLLGVLRRRQNLNKLSSLVEEPDDLATSDFLRH